MTPQPTSGGLGNPISHFARPQGDPAEMRKNAARLRRLVDDLNDQLRESGLTRIEGKGGLVTKVNLREDERARDLRREAGHLMAAAAELDSVADAVERAQESWDKNDQARTRQPDAR